MAASYALNITTKLPSREGTFPQTSPQNCLSLVEQPQTSPQNCQLMDSTQVLKHHHRTAERGGSSLKHHHKTARAQRVDASNITTKLPAWEVSCLKHHHRTARFISRSSSNITTKLPGICGRLLKHHHRPLSAVHITTKNCLGLPLLASNITTELPNSTSPSNITTKLPTSTGHWPQTSPQNCLELTTCIT